MKDAESHETVDREQAAKHTREVIGENPLGKETGGIRIGIEMLVSRHIHAYIEPRKALEHLHSEEQGDEEQIKEKHPDT